jgi:flagellar hook-length control protein FliK
VTVATVSTEAENGFMATMEQRSEAKLGKAEVEPPLNAAPAVNPVPSKVADSPEPAKTAETTSPVVTKEALTSQIISGAKLMVKDGVSKIQIQLEPAELGKLELSLVIERDSVAARFVTETQGVQSLIESNLTQLRSSLEEAGLSVDLLQVGVQTGTNQQNHAPSGDEQQERNARWAVSPSRLYGVEEEVFAEEAWHGMVNIRA